MSRASPIKCALLAIGLLVPPGFSARAEEAIRTGPDPIAAAAAAIEAIPPSAAPEPEHREAMEDDERPTPGRCAAPEDRKPHGMVWGAVGTGGYREVGGVATQPIGRCGSVTVMINRTEGGGYRGRGWR